MRLAKPCVDVGLMAAGPIAPMLRFWQDEVGLPFEELLPTGGGNHQHRHGLNGSVLKLNHAREGVPEAPPTGLRELWIARPGLAAERALRDPEGNRVRLVPPGTRGVEGIGLRMAVRDPAAHAAFYRDALQLEELAPDTFACGSTRLLLERDPSAGADATIRGPGYRYVTVQVFDCDGEHARILATGGREGGPPRTLGDVARFSFVRDPDGNWIEISQRKSLTGSLA